MASGIKTFTSGGKGLPFRQRPVFPNNGGDPQPIRARLRNRGLLAGRNVRIVNPKAAPTALARRSSGLGQGGI